MRALTVLALLFSSCVLDAVESEDGGVVVSAEGPIVQPIVTETYTFINSNSGAPLNSSSNKLDMLRAVMMTWHPYNNNVWQCSGDTCTSSTHGTWKAKNCYECEAPCGLKTCDMLARPAGAAYDLYMGRISYTPDSSSDSGFYYADGQDESNYWKATYSNHTIKHYVHN